MSTVAQSQSAASPEAAPPKYWSPARRSHLATATLLALGFAACAAILHAWQLPPFQPTEQATENAYVRGRTTVVAPQVSGYVTQVLVHDFQDVRRGQVLVNIDDGLYQARVDAAQANLDSAKATLANSEQARASRMAALASQRAGLVGAEAQLRRAQAELARIDNLVSDGSVSQRERDQAAAVLAQSEAGVLQSRAAGDMARQEIRSVEVGRNALRAQVAAAQAQLRLAVIDLEHAVIRAPEDGQVGEVGVRLGQYVATGSQLLALVPPDRWIVANYKEVQTASLRSGQSARFTVDALGGQAFTGTVESLSPAAGSEFAVLKPDNATGNFVKVPQRIGVRVLIDPRQAGVERLRPGMSVELAIETKRP
jgi:multidrug resistance efflux pump